MDDELTEHEYDHVMFGYYNGEPKVNPKEVQAWKWISMPKLREEISASPGSFTPWLRLCLERVISSYKHGHA